MKAYHFLKDDMCGGYGNEPAWEVGEERDIGDDNLELCRRGYHSSPSWLAALGYAMGTMACIVKVSKPIAKDSTKYVSRRRKLINARNSEKVLRYWACDCAERALKKTKVTDKRSWNAIKVARLYNKGKATKKELSTAWDAAGAAARAAVRATAWDAARVAAGDAAVAAGNAARDAEEKYQCRRLNWYMNKLFKEKIT